MSTVYLNRNIDEPSRRESVYAGDFYLYTAFPAAVAIADYIKDLVSEVFGEIDPERAQHELPVDRFREMVGPLKSRFTNDDRTKELCQQFATGFGCDPEDTYFDLPRLRVIPSGDYLTTGVSYNYAVHRDPWYAHPVALVNYWVPVYPVVGENAMAMFPGYFHRPVANRSADFDYDEWVEHHRFKAANQGKTEERPHPLPEEEIDRAGQIAFAGNSGDVLMFSTCHLHASIPNSSGVTRFSYDLRTVSLKDVIDGSGPANVDNSATGTTLGDFLRVSDLEPLDKTCLPSSVSGR